MGKTATAIQIAQVIGGEIVSADSRQIYQGMEIGTSAPSKEEQDLVKHHLVSCVEPDYRISAGQYAKMANKVIAEIQQREKIPIIVGGSGLYIRAIIKGLAPIPPVNPELRRNIEIEIKSKGIETLIAELAQVDPVYAQKVGIRDRKRLVRALEVYRATGKPFSWWHQSDRLSNPLKNNNSNKDFIIFGLIRPKPELYYLIEQRVDKMLNSGWVQEVERLIESYKGIENLPPPIKETVGYLQIARYLNGEISLENAKEQIIIATRQFSKRQLTWFRADRNIKWLECSGSDAPVRWANDIIQIINLI